MEICKRMGALNAFNPSTNLSQRIHFPHTLNNLAIRPFLREYAYSINNLAIRSFLPEYSEHILFVSFSLFPLCVKLRFHCTCAAQETMIKTKVATVWCFFFSENNKTNKDVKGDLNLRVHQPAGDLFLCCTCNFFGDFFAILFLEM